MKKQTAVLIAALLLSVLVLAIPVHAIKVYVNPSIQTGNYSPDGAYQEAAAMQDVASRLTSKLQTRGFDVRNSAWTDLYVAMDQSNAWGADCFVALHTDATGNSWSSTHGTKVFYYQSPGGWYDSRNADLASHIADRMTVKFNAFGRGYNWGGMADYPYLLWNLDATNPSLNYAIPATLVEGLYHSNWDDLYSVLMTSAGKDAYAQGVFEGICDYYGWSYSGNKPTPCVGNNSDGRIEVFCRGKDKALYHAAITTGGGWSSWMNMGGSFKGNPIVINNQDGRMEVFCVGTDGALYCTHQTSPSGGWLGSWTNLGGNWPDKPTATRDSNGCIWVFLRGTTNNIYYKYQISANGDWSANWQILNQNTNKAGPVAITDNNGYMHVFAVGTGGTLVEDKQLSGGSWSGWVGLGGPWNHSPIVAKNQDGRLELFIIGNDGKMNHKWQNSNGTWAANWDNTLGGNWVHDPVAFPDQNGALQVFCVGTTGALYTKYQTAPNAGWNADWVNLGGTWSADPGIGMNADGRDELFMVGNDPYMYHSWESAPNGPYGGWSTLGPNTIF